MSRGRAAIHKIKHVIVIQQENTGPLHGHMAGLRPTAMAVAESIGTLHRLTHGPADEQRRWTRPVRPAVNWRHSHPRSRRTGDVRCAIQFSYQRIPALAAHHAAGATRAGY
jgi:hypothetical protein